MAKPPTAMAAKLRQGIPDYRRLKKPRTFDRAYDACFVVRTGGRSLWGGKRREAATLLRGATAVLVADRIRQPTHLGGPVATACGG
ncbi:hypothetical protein NDU88_005894 [Pleurodeles waltl]|uniref:Uncharacterized protein n=1 Tax=Pleurodeles waltl TaxID=8319 RepID=A0AAV7MXN4_PLEWA|nr:hypothetical protein NDU88_005894 [Pleurodeles waltl]